MLKCPRRTNLIDGISVLLKAPFSCSPGLWYGEEFDFLLIAFKNKVIICEHSEGIKLANNQNIGNTFLSLMLDFLHLPLSLDLFSIL